MNEDLHAILRTIQEVEVSLERRYARAEGTLLMIWGLVAASIFAFYQLVEWNHETYDAALGPWLSWVWVGPMLAGYVASALVGARLGRMGATADHRRDLRRAALVAVIVAVLVSALVLVERYHYIYGVVTAVSGLALVVFAWDAPRSSTRRTSLVTGLAMNAVGVALLVWSDHHNVPGIASLTFLIGYLTLGTVKYRTGA